MLELPQDGPHGQAPNAAASQPAQAESSQHNGQPLQYEQHTAVSGEPSQEAAHVTEDLPWAILLDADANVPRVDDIAEDAAVFITQPDGSTVVGVESSQLQPGKRRQRRLRRSVHAAEAREEAEVTAGRHRHVATLCILICRPDMARAFAYDSPGPAALSALRAEQAAVLRATVIRWRRYALLGVMGAWARGNLSSCPRQSPWTRLCVTALASFRSAGDAVLPSGYAVARHSWQEPSQPAQQSCSVVARPDTGHDGGLCNHVRRGRTGLAV